MLFHFHFSIYLFSDCWNLNLCILCFIMIILRSGSIGWLKRCLSKDYGNTLPHVVQGHCRRRFINHAQWLSEMEKIDSKIHDLRQKLDGMLVNFTKYKSYVDNSYQARSAKKLLYSIHYALFCTWPFVQYKDLWKFSLYIYVGWSLTFFSLKSSKNL